MKERYEEGAGRLAGLIEAKARELKAAGETILIFPHKSVDGDCIGSSCALAGIFRNLGARAWVAMPELLPDNMSFLGVEDLLFYPPDDFLKTDMKIDGSFCSSAFSVDCSEGHRMGPNSDLFDSFEEAFDIDHHEVTNLRSPIKWIDPGASSACEMVFYVAIKLANLMGVELSEVIDKRTACCLMAGVVTDTGRFTYTNTKPETLETAGLLMQLGGDITEVCYNLFDMKTQAELKISGLSCLKARFEYGGRLAITVVTSDMFEECGAGTDDIAEVVSRLRDVKGVDFACVLRETGGGLIRGNLRSKSEFDCAAFASNYGGGGHKHAAGFTASGRDIHELAEEIITKAGELL